MAIRGAAGFCFILMDTGLRALAADPGDLLRTADRYADAGNWSAARDPYAQAEVAFRERGDKRNELYAKFGRLHRDVEAGSYATVLRELQGDMAIPIVQTDPTLRIRALSLKGTIDLNLNTAAAKDDYSQIRDLAKSIGDVRWENRAAGELGVIAGINGDLGTAGVMLFGAINKAAELHDLAAHMTFSVWLANGMAVNGMADRALKVLDKAADAVRNDPVAGMPIQLHIARIRALINLPEGPQRDAGLGEAQRLVDDALVSARKSNTLGAQAELLNQAGLIAQKRGDLNAAAKYFSDTADVARRAALPRMQAEALYFAAKIYRAQRQLVPAEAAIDAAISEQRKAQEAYDLPLYLAEKAEIENGLNHPARANGLYVQATALTESMLVNAPSSRVKSSMIETMGAVYLGHFRLALMTLHSPAKAFEIVESARGRTLADTLLAVGDGPSSEATTPADLEISRLQAQLRRPSTTEAETKRLQAKLDQAYGALVPVEYARDRAEVARMGRPVPLAVVRNELRAGETLIEYVLMDDIHSYAFEITKAHVRVHTLAPRREIETLAQKYVKSVRSKEDASDSAKMLFQLVIAPALTSRAESVTVIPDGVLQMVPFASLRDDKDQYWISSVQIASAPSATVFHRLRSVEQKLTPAKPFLGVAFSPEEKSRTLAKMSNLRGASFGEHSMNLKPLPYAQQEVLAAANVFGNDSVLLQGDRASEGSLSSEGLANFRIIHIAAHGVSDLVEPDRAGLVLASAGPSDDGFWQAREIRRSRLAADLVTLSACDTGVGRLQGEEGIMNLARSFLVAGAKSVMASLWEVDDRSTATLMAHFYKHVASGQTIAESLRDAQKEMLTEFGNEAKPYFWSGFTVIGDGTRKIVTQARATQPGTAVKNLR
jgi:CHAT domain-containing protein